MMHRLIGIVFGFMLLGAALPLAAQEDHAPIYLAIDGVLWQTTVDRPVLEPVTACALPSGERILGAPVMSPDGTRLALRIEPQLVSEALARVGGWGGGENPSDLAICDPESGIVLRFSQPDDARLFDPSGQPDHFTIRSIPDWSQDGSALAWTECEEGCDSPRLLTADLASGQSQIMAELPGQYGVPASIPVTWGGPLILVVSEGYDATTNTPDPRLFAFDPASGEQVLDLSTAPGQSDSYSFVTDVFWSDPGQSPRIIMLRSSGAWIAVDPATGATRLLEGVPEAYSALASGGLSAVGDARAAQAFNLRWLARDGETLTLLGDDVRGFTPPSIAPDGSALVFYDNLTPMIWQDGAVSALPLPPMSPNTPVYVVWGPGLWRTFTGELPSDTVGFVCFGAPAPRLQAGAQAVVAEEFGANNLRAEPNTSASLLGTIPEGAVIDVTSGPVCADGYAWWQVTYNGQSGWTAEGEGLDYWLEPAG